MNKPRNSRGLSAAVTFLLSALITACSGSGGDVDFGAFPTVTQQPPVTTVAAFPTAAPGTAVQTFVLGNPPTNAQFSGGIPQGTAWIIPEGATGVVEFATPADAVALTATENFGAAAPLLRAKASVACAISDQGFDSTAAFGAEMFVRGSVSNDWAVTPGVNNLVATSDTTLEARFEIVAGDYEYKVADAGWTIERAFIDDDTTLDTAVTMTDPGPGGPNGTITIPEDGCYSWIVEASDTDAPVLTVSKFDDTGGNGGNGGTPGVCGVDDAGNDATVPFGSEMFVRGSVSNDWAVTPGVNNLVNVGGNTLEAQFEIVAGSYEYKVADAGWTIERAFIDDDTTLDTAVAMIDPGPGGPNGTITFVEDGCYSWEVVADDTDAPVLTVSQVDLSGDGNGPPPEAAGSEVRIVDVNGDELFASEDAGDIGLVRRGAESRIARIEIENKGGVGDVGIENFEWTADTRFAPDPVTVTIAYTRPDGDYSDTVINVNGEDFTCQPSTTDEFGCTVDVPVTPFSAVDFTVTNGGVPDAEGGGSFAASDGSSTFYTFEGSGQVAENLPAVPGEDEVILYYNRPDGNYTGFGLHLFPTDPAGPSWTNFPTPGEYLPEGIDDTYGAFFRIGLPQNVSPAYSANPGPVAEFPTVLGFIIHKGDTKDPGPDQFIRIAVDGNVLFVQSGVNDVGTAPPIEGLVSIVGAAAHYVQAGTLIWDHDAEVASVELLISPDASVKVGTGGFEGNFETVSLTPTANPNLPNFLHLASAPAYGFPATFAEVDFKAALRGRLVAVGRDAAGLMVEATSVQTSGALDDLYAAAATSASLGVNYEGGVPVLRVWAPTAQLDTGVSVNIYDVSGTLADTVAMTLDEASGVWSITGDGSWNRMYYRYALTVYSPSAQALVANEVTDPYSISLSANSLFSQIVNLDDGDLKPAGWDVMVKPALDAPEDIIVYETHIRDFSIDDRLIQPGDRGKYTAFADPNGTGWQHLQALAAAGLTHLHLLPAFDIATVNENEAERVDLGSTVDELCAANSAAASLCPDSQTIRELLESLPGDSQQQQQISAWMKNLDGFNWGYDPFHYNAPEGSYSTDPDGTQRILEFRSMVQGLNDAGLRTVMDVVYNHTNDFGQNQKSVLDKVVPGYYHRLNDRTGDVLRNSCCPDTAAEFAMMEKLLIDSTLFWVRQYKVDGFRFDLMSFHPKSTMQKLRQDLDALSVANDGVDGAKVYVYGEAWQTGDIKNDARFVQSTQKNLGGTGIGSFNDRLRDAVRGGGPFDGGISHIINQGFISGRFYDPNAENSGSDDEKNDLLAKADNIRVWLAGGLADYELVNAQGDTVTGKDIPYTNQDSGYTQDPQEAINYIGKHDNETLWDISQYKQPAGTGTADRVRAHTVGNSFILLAQGVPFLHAGQDLLRSKSMDDNSFDSGDWFNELDFSGQDTKFRVGLPSEQESGGNWTQIQQIFGDVTAEPAAADIQAASDGFRDLLALRQSSPLFRLRTGDDIRQRLSFHNTGPDQIPGVIVMGLDGCVTAAVNDPTYGNIVTVFNATDAAQTIALFTDETWDLHPVQVVSSDIVVQTAAHDASGFAVPARTTAVFVQAQSGEACAVGAQFDAVTAFVRGGFTDWGTTAPLSRVGDTPVLEATINIVAGSYEYKVASEDWSSVNCGGPEGGAALPTPVDASTVLECGTNPSNLALDVAANGDLKFSLDTTAVTTPTISIGAPAGIGFASDTALIRGGFNDWGNTAPTTAVGPQTLEATLSITAGSYEFKVASDDWATINCGGPQDGSLMPVTLGNATTLSCNANPANLSVSIPADGDYTFSLDKLDPGNPVLTLGQASGAGFGAVSAFARGGFNDWGTANELVSTGGDVYEAVIPVTAGSFEFKVASDDWATVNCGGAANMPAIALSTPTTLSCGANPGNLVITFDADGNVTFSVDAGNNNNPTLTVSP